MCLQTDDEGISVGGENMRIVDSILPCLSLSYLSRQLWIWSHSGKRGNYPASAIMDTRRSLIPVDDIHVFFCFFLVDLPRTEA